MSLITKLKGRLGVKGFGWKPDPEDERDRKFGAHVRVPDILPKEYSLEKHVESVLDQRATSSCVAHAAAQAFRVALSSKGQRAWMPSRLFIYYNSRRYHDGQDFDDGTYPRTAMKGLIKYGAPPEEAWRFDERRVNVAPEWHAYQAGIDFRGPHGYYRIFSSGADRADEVRSAIASGYPVTLATSVDRRFLDTGGSYTIGPPSNDIVGGHAMCCVGYDGDRFRVVNSWGSGWRDGGFFWMTWEWLTHPDVRDLWVIVP